MEAYRCNLAAAEVKMGEKCSRRVAAGDGASPVALPHAPLARGQHSLRCVIVGDAAAEEVTIAGAAVDAQIVPP